MPISSSAGLWTRLGPPGLLCELGAGDGSRLAVGSSTTARSVARRRFVSSRRRGGPPELAAAAGAGRDQHVVALVDAVQNVGDALADALGRDVVLDIVGFLLF